MKPTVLLGLVLGTILALVALLGSVYTYGEHRYAAGGSDEQRRQQAAMDALNRNLDTYVGQELSTLEVAARIREQLSLKVISDLSHLPSGPKVKCDYPEPIRAQVNALGRRK